MYRAALVALAMLLCPTSWVLAQTVARARVTYDTYALGIEVMQMQASFSLGPWTYRVGLDYHTTGLASVLYHGQQTNTVHGTWDAGLARPSEFFGEGSWRGQARRALIDYSGDQPVIRTLVPPNDNEREPVPDALRARTMDTLSALAQLVRKVEQTNTCETTVRTYDGRRLTEVSAHTVGMEKLAPNGRSTFSGDALRCDFQGRELAGFLLGQDDPEHHGPLYGSAWMAPLLPGAPKLPVRIAFQTRWFGWTTMYLTAADQDRAEAEGGSGTASR